MSLNQQLRETCRAPASRELQIHILFQHFQHQTIKPGDRDGRRDALTGPTPQKRASRDGDQVKPQESLNFSTEGANVTIAVRSNSAVSVAPPVMVDKQLPV